jgi:hypothetical protein
MMGRRKYDLIPRLCRLMKNKSKKNNFFHIFATFKNTFHLCFVVALTCTSKLSIEPFEQLRRAA